jgi:DNA-binding NarL/FixJ family response regulator
MIRVFIVDDHALMREGLKALLARGKDIEVIGEGHEGASAVGPILEQHPDVVLMDIGMPGVNGLDAADKLTALDDRIRILFLSAYYDRALLQQAIAAGGSGYLIKTAGAQELLSAVRTVNHGGRYYSPELFGLFSEQFSSSPIPYSSV